MKSESKTVLVIEDELDIRRFASRLLELEGYRILQAEDGEEGLRLVRENHPALLLLDIRLPKVDGWEVLRQIKGNPKLSMIPVVVFSASVGPDQQEKALDMGAAEYIVKPVEVSRLKDAVARILHAKAGV